MGNPKIGHYLPDGSLQYPTETLAGAPFVREQESDHAPAALHNLGGVYFCVGDVFNPPGFDVQAAVDALRAEVAPKATSKAAKAAASSDSGQG